MPRTLLQCFSKKERKIYHHFRFRFRTCFIIIVSIENCNALRRQEHLNLPPFIADDIAAHFSLLTFCFAAVSTRQHHTLFSLGCGRRFGDGTNSTWFIVAADVDCVWFENRCCIEVFQFCWGLFFSKFQQLKRR